MSNNTQIERSKIIRDIPILPLRDVVVYPNTVIPLFIGRQTSIKSLESVTTDVEENKPILLVAQKNPTDKVTKSDELYEVGTLANVLRLLKLSDGTAKVIVEGTRRCTIHSIEEKNDYLTATVTPFTPSSPKAHKELDALIRMVLEQFEQYIRLNHRNIPVEIIEILSDLEDPDRLSDMIAMHLSLRIHDKQALLELFNAKTRLKKLSVLLESEIDLLQVQQRLHERLKKQVAKTQKDYYLTEQLKAIQKELDVSQGEGTEFDRLADRIKKAKMPEEAHEKAMAELNKLKMMGTMSAEATVSRNYLETLLNIPWHKKTKISYDLKQASKILDKAHYGLEKVKERIIEFLAVQKRVRKLKGPILCLVGPPGVGKTSLGQSVATAMGREFIRMSLGGVRDEAEIRGHRRTYIGSMPGQIMQKMTKAKVKNPLFMLDEIDKMSMDFRGDPASALLEVLDPEQNQAFNDHYLEVDYDLSDVLFIATANTLNIPDALLDRMEVIHISGYTESEKAHIAQQYLIPKQKKQNGLKASELKLNESTILDIIRYYTLEAGVRNLEREIATLCRKIVMALSKPSAPEQMTVAGEDLEHHLGVQRFRYGLADKEDTIGQVTGLAWTSVGGELLSIESAFIPGTGKMSYTGQLGEVMQESIQTAFTLVRSRSGPFGIEPSFYDKADIHIHVPEGATPKDGPSAGIGMCTALFSSLLQKPVRADVAMTGEVTLLGKVLPIGGLKEKLLAAHRGGIRLVIIPEENKRDLKEIPKNVLQALDIHTVRWVDEALELAFRTPLSTYRTHPDEDTVTQILKHHTQQPSTEDPVVH